jgi:phosphate transport system substrate-binding protein
VQLAPTDEGGLESLCTCDAYGKYGLHCKHVVAIGLVYLARLKARSPTEGMTTAPDADPVSLPALAKLENWLGLSALPDLEFHYRLSPSPGATGGRIWVLDVRRTDQAARGPVQVKRILSQGTRVAPADERVLSMIADKEVRFDSKVVLNDEELASTFAACAAGTTAFEVPAYISPIAVIFNVDGVTELNLDAATIAKIYTGAITKWNDAAIVAMNPDAKLPDLAITPVHRSDDSGTSKNFSDYLFQNAKADWAIEKPADTFPFQTGEGAKGTSGVVDAVTNGVGTIGYADASKAGKLGIAKLKVGNDFVMYTPEAAAAVVAESTPVDGRAAGDMAIKINRTTTDSTHYPLVLVSYLMGCNEYAKAGVAENVKAYFAYILSPEGQATAASAAGSAPLATKMADEALAVVNAIK